MRTNDRHDEPARPPAERGGKPGPRPERVAEVRRRIREGFYDSAAVLDEVARRMLARGDV
ncbi:MAG TPA: hypothetical protein VHG51_03430 [Longimicrobiaceae bacterium]|nr:hypothetical protein [Longimicrobiaceae bacterium]